jgi:imidazolonepropionase-like amidohydrolase
MRLADETRDIRIFSAFIVTTLLAGVGLVVLAHRNVYPGLPPESRPLVIRGATLFDGTERAPREDAVVVIEGERITCTGTCPVPADARVLDASGLACLPGLIDLNIHLSSPLETDRDGPLLRMVDFARQRPEARRAFHESGVTAIRELGNLTGAIFALKQRIASGQLAGPSMFAAGPMFTAPGGIPASTDFGDNPYLIERATRQVSEPAAAQAEVRRLARDGADGIAAVVDGGLFDLLPRLAPDVLRAIVEEAHVQRLWVAVNTGRVRDVREAVEAGVDTIEGGSVYDPPLDPDTITLLRAHGVTFVPSLARIEAFLRLVERDERPAGYPADVWGKLRQRVRDEGILNVMSPFFDGVRAAARAGVRIGAGTSGGMAFGASLHRELALLVQAGLSPTEALMAATRNAAHALRQEREQGTVEPGKVANLVLVTGRPWVRIEDSTAVRLVIDHGRVVAGAL